MGDLETLATGLDFTDATGGIMAIAGGVAAVLIVLFGWRKLVKTVNKS